MTNKKIDSRPFVYVFSLFLVFIGSFLAWGLQIIYYYSISGIGILLILISTFKSHPDTSLVDPQRRKRNMILGIIILILSFAIIWITFENRFNLETMAKTKSI